MEEKVRLKLEPAPPAKSFSRPRPQLPALANAGCCTEAGVASEEAEPEMSGAGVVEAIGRESIPDWMAIRDSKACPTGLPAMDITPGYAGR